jgi:hypothetical protein
MQARTNSSLLQRLGESDSDDEFQNLSSRKKESPYFSGEKGSISKIAHNSTGKEETKEMEPDLTDLVTQDDDTKKPERVPIIYFGTRTHKQISQIVNELKENTLYRPKMTILYVLFLLKICLLSLQ